MVKNHFVDAAPNNGTRENTTVRFLVCQYFTVGSYRYSGDRASPSTRMALTCRGITSPLTGTPYTRSLTIRFLTTHFRYYGHNGDDCISVINGGKDIVAKNGFCGFSSHGLSIGSLGRDGANHTVQNVLFKNWTMDGAVYGARVRIPDSVFYIA